LNIKSVVWHSERKQLNEPLGHVISELELNWTLGKKKGRAKKLPNQLFVIISMFFWPSKIKSSKNVSVKNFLFSCFLSEGKTFGDRIASNSYPDKSRTTILIDHDKHFGGHYLDKR